MSTSIFRKSRVVLSVGLALLVALFGQTQGGGLVVSAAPPAGALRTATVSALSRSPPSEGCRAGPDGSSYPLLPIKLEPSTSPDPAPSMSHRLIEVVNRVRWEQGRLPPLKVDPTLERAALGHSQDMAEYDFFGHDGVDMSSPWDRIEAQGYETWFILGENIASGYRTPEEVVQAWLDSPNHRANMLNEEMREAGVGYVFEEDDLYPGETWGYQHYWTLDMGARWDSYPVVIEREAYSTTDRLVSLYLYGAEWATEMRLSNDGAHWSTWKPYQATVSWELDAGDGTRHVYVQLRDQEGTTLQAEDAIVLEENASPTQEPPPHLLVWPEQMVFVSQAGEQQGIPQRFRLHIVEETGRALVWNASWDQDWLRLSTPNGIAPSGIVLTLTEQAKALSPGTYTATVLVSGNGQRVRISVELLVFSQLNQVALPNLFCRLPR